VRFKRFISESNDLAAELDLLANECEPFLRDLERPLHPDSMMFRGMATSNASPIQKLTVKRNRRPTDTPLHLHRVADDWFFDNFGWRGRSAGLFCTGSKTQARGYGDVHAVFPVGDYEIIWSPRVKDLYREAESAFKVASQAVRSTRNFEDEAELKNEVMDQSAELLIHTLDHSSYRDGELIGGLRAMNEIMVNCDEYYAVKVGTEFWRGEFKSWLTEVDV